MMSPFSLYFFLSLDPSDAGSPCVVMGLLDLFALPEFLVQAGLHEDVFSPRIKLSLTTCSYRA